MEKDILETDRPQQLVVQVSGRLKVSEKLEPKIGNKQLLQGVPVRKETRFQNNFRPGLKRRTKSRKL